MVTTGCGDLISISGADTSSSGFSPTWMMMLLPPSTVSGVNSAASIVPMGSQVVNLRLSMIEISAICQRSLVHRSAFFSTALISSLGVTCVLCGKIPIRSR